MTFSIGNNLINPAYRKFNIDDFWQEAAHLYNSGFDCEMTPEELEKVEKLNDEFKQNTTEYELLLDNFSPSEKMDEDSEFMTCTSILRNLSEIIGPSVKLNSIALGRALNREGTGFEKKPKKKLKKTIYGYWLKRNLRVYSTNSHN